LIKYYTDAHDVDEELRTISKQGGNWWRENMTGIAQRELYNDPILTYSDVVASYVCEHHLLHPDGYHNVGYKIPTDQSIHMYPYLYKFS